MTVIRPHELAKIAHQAELAPKAVLIHGNDEGRVRELAKQLVVQHAGSHDDPFNVVHLDDAALKDDPGRLADEAQSISLMGGKRAVWVRGAGTAFTNVMKAYLQGASGDALIVADSPALRKGQPLRELFEKAPNAAAVACYEDTARDISGIIDEHLGKSGLKITNDARSYLAQILGADRALSRSELEKLSLYCADQTLVELSDVEAICGDASALSLDDTIDAVFEGASSDADHRLNRLLTSGTAPHVVISAATNHVIRLLHLTNEVAIGRSAKLAVDGARPPIFWKRKDSMVRQVTAWRAAALDTTLAQLREAELQTRQYPALAEAITGRTFLSITSRANRARR